MKSATRRKIAKKTVWLYQHEGKKTYQVGLLYIEMGSIYMSEAQPCTPLDIAERKKVSFQLDDGS